MDGELVNSEPSIEGGEGVYRPTSPFPYTEAFKQKFPYYLSIGMTYEQYWEQDCELVKDYREAEELRIERINYQAWLQGMYFYDALARVSPILHAYAKKGTKAKPYVEKPYAITKKIAKQQETVKEKAKSEKAKRYMEAIMLQHNKKYERK